MGHNFVVAHCRKVQTTPGLRNVADHNCRTAVYDREGRPLDPLPDFISHPERAPLNEGDRCGGLAVLSRRSGRILDADLARKPQKNAAAAIEIVISGSPEWFAKTKPDQWQSYFKDAREFLGKRYGQENVLHWAVHYDEMTPHMHMLLAPIVQTEKGAKYAASSFLGGRQGLRELQGEIAAQVGLKHGLERGMEGSKARHTDQYTWSSELAQERDNLAMEKGGLDIRRAVVQGRELEIHTRERELNARERGLDEREQAQKKAETAIKDAEKALAQRISDFEKLAEAKIGPFEAPSFKKPAFAGIKEFVASDGTKDLTWKEFVARETAIAAMEYANQAGTVSQSAQLKASKYEADAKQLPAALAQIRELKQVISRVERASPAQLREWADQKETAQRQGKERGNLGDYDR
jgi:hypothetical protein